MSSLALCDLLLTIGLEPVLQTLCRDPQPHCPFQAELLGAHALGHLAKSCLLDRLTLVGAGDQPGASPRE